jgi:hypothetical protein
MNDESLDKLRRFSAILITISGVSQLIAGILSVGLITPLITLILYGSFLIWMGFQSLRLQKKNNFTKDKLVVMFGCVVPLLNLFANLTLFLFQISERPIIGYFLIVHMVISVITFPINYYSKMQFDGMDKFEAFTFAGIILTRGLGLGYLFQPLGWIIGVPNFIMIGYLITFALLNSFMGRKIYSEKENKGIQIRAIIIMSINFIVGATLLWFFPSPNQVIFVTCALLAVLIRTYYVRKKFNH